MSIPEAASIVMSDVMQILDFETQDNLDCSVNKKKRAVFLHLLSSISSLSNNDQISLRSTVNHTADKSLRVFTLNCWGLMFVSRHRVQRIKSIAQHIKEQDYDIVFLQEVSLS